MSESLHIAVDTVIHHILPAIQKVTQQPRTRSSDNIPGPETTTRSQASPFESILKQVLPLINPAANTSAPPTSLRGSDNVSIQPSPPVQPPGHPQNMATTAISIAGIVATIVSTVIDAMNKRSSSLERRRQFTQDTVRALSEQGYNAVCICTPYKAAGYSMKKEHRFEGTTFTILAAPKGSSVMIVENLGDGGYENWALRGRNWVRWGKIVKFHAGQWKEKGMGKKYEVRNKKDFPGWELR